MVMGWSMCLTWCLWQINSESRITEIKSGQSVNPKQFGNPWQIRTNRG